MKAATLVQRIFLIILILFMDLRDDNELKLEKKQVDFDDPAIMHYQYKQYGYKTLIREALAVILPVLFLCLLTSIKQLCNQFIFS